LEIRPVFHKNDERIRSHVFLCMRKRSDPGVIPRYRRNVLSADGHRQNWYGIAFAALAQRLGNE
jgi:hypothetical protein